MSEVSETKLSVTNLSRRRRSQGLDVGVGDQARVGIHDCGQVSRGSGRGGRIGRRRDRDRLLPRGGSRENALDEEEEEDRADGERGRGPGPTPEADTVSKHGGGTCRGDVRGARGSDSP